MLVVCFPACLVWSCSGTPHAVLAYVLRRLFPHIKCAYCDTRVFRLLCYCFRPTWAFFSQLIPATAIVYCFNVPALGSVFHYVIPIDAFADVAVSSDLSSK